MAAKKKKKKTAQQPGQIQKCIFCGGVPLTREHFWPSWMKDVMPKSAHNKHVRVESTKDDLSFKRPNEGKATYVTGPPNSWQLKVVCSKCNNGWMSQIETAAQQILNDLAFNNSTVLTKPDQDILSKWAFLKVIIGQYDSVENRIIKAPERRIFLETRVVPSDWKIWIARVDPPIWHYAYNQTNATFDYTDNTTQISGVHRAKSAMFTLGHLIIHVAKFTTSEFGTGAPEYAILGNHHSKVHRIQPIIDSKVEWQKITPLDSEELYQLHNNLRAFTAFIRDETQRHLH